MKKIWKHFFNHSQVHFGSNIKKWFVGIEIDLKNLFSYEICSIPSCKSIYEIVQSENLHQINLRFSSEPPNLPYFPNVRKLHINLNLKAEIDLGDSLSKIINLSELHSIEISSSFLNKDNENILCDLLKSLEQCSKLSSMIINSRSSQYQIYPYLKKIFRLIPRQIQFLQIPIREVKDFGILLKHCENFEVKDKHFQ